MTNLEMNKSIIGFIWFLLVFLSNCSALKIKGNIEYELDSILCSVEFVNKSNTMISLPTSLVITPNKKNTLHGVVKLYKHINCLKRKKIEHRIFDIDIPIFYYIDIDGVFEDEQRVINLEPKDSYIYLIDFGSFYDELTAGDYSLKIDLDDIGDNGKTFNQNIVIPFSVE